MSSEPFHGAAAEFTGTSDVHLSRCYQTSGDRRHAFGPKKLLPGTTSAKQGSCLRRPCGGSSGAECAPMGIDQRVLVNGATVCHAAYFIGLKWHFGCVVNILGDQCASCHFVVGQGLSILAQKSLSSAMPHVSNLVMFTSIGEAPMLT